MLEQQLEIANRYLREGDYDIAEIAFQQALRIAPDSSLAREGLQRAQRKGRKHSGNSPTRVDTSWAQRVPLADAPSKSPAIDLKTALKRLQDTAPSRALACRILESESLGEPEARRAEWREEIRLRSRRTLNHPHVFFYNVTNSGASALDPILRELFSSDYLYEAVGTPVDTEWLQPYLDGPVPFYHWTHTGPKGLSRWLACDRVKVLCLYRDPRDILVSHARDPQNLPGWRSLTPGEVIGNLAEGEFPGFFADVSAWLALGPERVFSFRFEEMKQDIPGLIRRILNFLGLPINEERVQAVCEAHSFKRQTGRDRGQEGPTVRTAYMVRKGVSGDWRNYFDAQVAARFLPRCGQYLIDWGYEPDHSWVQSLAQAAVAPKVA